jgi:predicted XRE-type DNA-binding protein
MRRRIDPDESTPHLTRGSVLDDLGFGASEALEIKVKAEIYRELLKYIKDRGFSQQELGMLLGIHQPDTSNLLNGRVSKFSVGKLIKFAGKLNLGAQVRLTKPRPARSVTVAASRKSEKRANAAA